MKEWPERLDSKPLYGGELAGVVEQNAKAAPHAVLEIEPGENTSRKPDGTPVPARGVDIRRYALIKLDPLIRADRDVHYNLLHLGGPAQLASSSNRRFRRLT